MERRENLSADAKMELPFDSQLSELLYNKISQEQWDQWAKTGLSDADLQKELLTRLEAGKPSSQVTLGIQTVPQLQIWRLGSALYKKEPALKKIRGVMQIPYPEAVAENSSSSEEPNQAIPTLAAAPAMPHDLDQPALIDVAPDPPAGIPHGDPYLDKLCLEAHNAKDARVAASNDEREANNARASGIRGKGHEKYLWQAPDGQWWIVVPKLPANPKLVEIKCDPQGKPLNSQEAEKANAADPDSELEEEE